MNWSEKRNHLTEQLEILKKLRKRFGKEVVEIASNARLTVHKKWMKDLSKHMSGRPSEIFKHSAFSVTSDENNLLVYEVLEDSDERFVVKITKCKYANFYIEKGEPEIGYAMHCALDFGETEAFSSDVILKRTKTLMQGDDCCDHCYTLKKQELPKNDVGVVPHKVFMILDLIVPPNLKNQDYLSEVFYDTNYTPSGG